MFIDCIFVSCRSAWNIAWASCIDVLLDFFFFVHVYFASFWKVGCRYWCVDGTGMLYVFPVQLFARHDIHDSVHHDTIYKNDQQDATV
jgi:integral membrane sensor domain MASE1